jgi:hypothetical protein
VLDISFFSFQIFAYHSLFKLFLYFIACVLIGYQTWSRHLVCTTYAFLFQTPYFLSLCGSTTQFWALAASMKLSVSFQLLDLGQSAGLLGRVISSSQGLCVSAAGDCDDDGEVGGMNGFGRGNRNTRRKPSPTPLWPPQIPLASG